MAMRLATGQSDLEKYKVKRPDGGEYIAFASVDVVPDWDMNDDEESIYKFCGDMWRGNMENDIWWKSWQLDCHWTDRKGGWRNNRNEDFEMLYFWLNGLLPETAAHVEDYARLMDKGYILRNDDNYKCNIILCDSERKWWEMILRPDEEIKTLCREYDAEALKAELFGQPEHMHGLIKAQCKNFALNLHTRVMKNLLDMGVLKVPTLQQAKGLCTVMFTGK